MSNVAGLWPYPLRRGETVADQDWFPLYFHRLLGSDFVAIACAGGEAGRAAGFTAFLLWCEAVKQDPAGTLPDNDIALARLAGYGADLVAWREIRAAALYGWEPCLIEGDDDQPQTQVRLAHRTVTEFVTFAWRRKHGRQVGRGTRKRTDTKWKVRDQMRKARRPQRMIEDDMLVTRVAEWLIAGVLPCTAENVAAGLAEAGVAQVVPFMGSENGKENRG